MKNRLYLLLLLATICLVGGLIAGLSAQGKAGPKANVFPSASYNFGAVLPGAKLNHTFQIKNNGGANLQIKGIKWSCGCTKAIADSVNIRPNESANIYVEIAVTQTDKKFFQEVVVETNDPDNRLICLQLSATIDNPIVLDSAGVDYGIVRLDNNRNLVRKVRAKIPGFKDAKLLRWDADVINGKSVSVKVQFDEAKSEAVVSATLENQIVPGPFTEIILLSVWDKDKKVATREIYVIGNVLGSIAASPSFLVWNMKNSDRRKHLTLDCANDRDISVYLSDNFKNIITARVDHNSVVVDLLPGADIINKLQYVSKLSGFMLLKDDQGAAVRIPLEILGQ